MHYQFTGAEKLPIKEAVKLTDKKHNFETGPIF